MIRWRYCLVMAMLLLLPTRTGSKSDDDVEQERQEEPEEDDDDDDDDDDYDDATEKVEHMAVWRAPPVQPSSKEGLMVTSTVKRRSSTTLD